MTFVFGMEIGFKLSTKTFIYVFNPCHITTIIQIYLLAAKPSKRTTALFRIQMNYLNGPFLAFVFPDAESRHLPLEQATYWIQHGLMFIISIYLLRLDGAYSTEYILDFKWNIIGYSSLILYHFTVLQFLSMISGVNLNYMLCPAISDPFQGSNYRIAAVIHQAILCPFLCKLFTIIFSNTNQIQVDVKVITNNVDETMYSNTNNDYDTAHQQHHHYHYDYHPSHHDQLIYDKMTGLGSNIVKSSSSSLIGASIATSGLTTATAAVLSSSPAATNIIPPPVTISRIDDPIMTTKID